MTMNETINIKAVLSGEGAVGKTSLAITKLKGAFPEGYIPTKVDDPIVIESNDGDGKNVSVAFYDVEGGGEDWCTLRHLYYEETDLIVLCFSIDSPDSLQNVEEYWMHFLKKYVPKAPIVLVGTKKDLRNDEQTIKELNRAKQTPVSIEQGEEMAKKINAFAYLECSALLKEGVDEVFDTAAAKALILVRAKEKKKRNCRIL